MKDQRSSSGYIILTVLVIGLLLSWLGTIGAQVIINNARFQQFEERQEQALEISEAGINYYLWHLAHNPNDFKDGGTLPATAPYGPYIKDYKDSNGALIGTYELWITPPVSGTTTTTVKSIGRIPGRLKGSRTILAQLGQPSFSNYIWLSNVAMHFSATTTTEGPVHSNGCIQFDGANGSTVSSAQSTCNSGSDNGVWSDVYSNPGQNRSLWNFPVPPIDFVSVKAKLGDLKTQSKTADGLYLGASGSAGWYLNFKPTGKIDIYKVTSETNTRINKTLVTADKTPPANGIIFSPDEVWVSGTGWDGRVTVAAASFITGSPRSINIIDNLTYKLQDGTDAIGLIAEQDVFLPKYVPDTLEVDAAILAQGGSFGYDTTYGGLKDTFKLFGAIAQAKNDWALKTGTPPSYSNGFPITEYDFDPHLLYAPPPGFPTTGDYAVLNWRELLTAP